MLCRNPTQIGTTADDIVVNERFNAYRIMWMMVFFDLPTDTKKDRRHAARFRKDLIKDGFTMMQFSVYVRHCSSSENTEVHRKRVLGAIPPMGSVNILTVTDKQFGRMEIFYNTKPQEEMSLPQQLELF